MNRRGFIAILTALAGVVLARIKAPAAPIAAKWYRYPDKCPYCGSEGMPGYDTICLCQPLKDALDKP